MKKWRWVIVAGILLGCLTLWAVQDHSLDDEIKLVLLGWLALLWVGYGVRTLRPPRPRVLGGFLVSSLILAAVVLWSLYDHSLDDEFKIVLLGVLGVAWIVLLVRVGRSGRRARRGAFWGEPSAESGSLAVGCPNCGAPVPAGVVSGELVRCEYCGSTYRV